MSDAETAIEQSQRDLQVATALLRRLIAMTKKYPQDEELGGVLGQAAAVVMEPWGGYSLHDNCLIFGSSRGDAL